MTERTDWGVRSGDAGLRRGKKEERGPEKEDELRPAEYGYCVWSTGKVGTIQMERPPNKSNGSAALELLQYCDGTKATQVRSGERQTRIFCNCVTQDKKL